MSDMVRAYFGRHNCASQYIKTVMIQSAILMGWSPRVDRVPFVLPLGYHLQEPILSILLGKKCRLDTDPFVLLCVENADKETVAILDQHRNYKGFHAIPDMYFVPSTRDLLPNRPDARR